MPETESFESPAPLNDPTLPSITHAKALQLDRAGSKVARFMAKPQAHIALLVVGTLFFLNTAFHGNIWFDESYSVGIANKSFGDIWSIGANDVHPVLFYLCLHILNCVFGDSILAYRLFAVAGSVALAILGFTHIRRDWGAKAGVLFSFLVFTVPYIALMAVEIRMYTWASFTVTLCFIYGMRIARSVYTRSKVAGRADESNAEVIYVSSVPFHFWIVFILSSLASAYLHYFAAISAFLINVVLLGYLITHRHYAKRELVILIVGAVLQLVAYAPWLIAVASQLSVVSDTYWAQFHFPLTLFELTLYPFLDSPMMFALQGAYGIVLQIVTILLIALLAVLTIVVVVRAIHRVRMWHQDATDADKRYAQSLIDYSHNTAAASLISPEADDLWDAQQHSWYDWVAQSWWIRAVVAGLIVYIGLIVIGAVASLVMGSLILYYRYLSVALGPLLLAIVLLLAHMKRPSLVAGVCAVTLLFALTNQALLAHDDYSEQNALPLEAFVAAVNECSEAQAASVVQDSKLVASGSDLPKEDESDDISPADSSSQSAGTPVSPVLVMSSDIGFIGVTSIYFPMIPQVYMDWQHGNWDRAYEAYKPALKSVKTWETVLNDYNGKFVVLGQSKDTQVPRDITDVAAKSGVHQESLETYYRPYERTYFSIAVMSRDKR